MSAQLVSLSEKREQKSAKQDMFKAIEKAEVAVRFFPGAMVISPRSNFKVLPGISGKHLS